MDRIQPSDTQAPTTAFLNDTTPIKPIRKGVGKAVAVVLDNGNTEQRAGPIQKLEGCEEKAVIVLENWEKDEDDASIKSTSGGDHAATLRENQVDRDHDSLSTKLCVECQDSAGIIQENGTIDQDQPVAPVIPALKDEESQAMDLQDVPMDDDGLSLELAGRSGDITAIVLENVEIETNMAKIQSGPPPPSPPQPPPIKIPSILISMETQLSPKDTLPIPDFDDLIPVSRFILSYTGNTSSEVFLPNGVVLFKCCYPNESYWEGCHPDPMEKIVEVLDYRTSKLVMQLRRQTLPCHNCFEEETNSVDVIGPDEMLLATIIQKKTWTYSRISRDICIQPGPHGKSDTYKAQFKWNDASVNFKTHRSGLIVATLITDSQETPDTSNYVLQFLRDIRPRDKAILIGFMITRDILMEDETQTRRIVERASLVFVVVGLMLIAFYLFVISRN